MSTIHRQFVGDLPFVSVLTVDRRFSDDFCLPLSFFFTIVPRAYWVEVSFRRIFFFLLFSTSLHSGLWIAVCRLQYSQRESRLFLLLVHLLLMICLPVDGNVIQEFFSVLASLYKTTSLSIGILSGISALAASFAGPAVTDAFRYCN